jgi:FkbM family methyltransferase
MKVIQRYKQLVNKWGLCRSVLYAVPISFIDLFLKFNKSCVLRQIKNTAKHGFIVMDINGSKMMLDVNDEGLPQDLMMNPIREEYATKMLAKIIKAGDCVVDIGANMGYYALLESKLAGENGIVYAIEPVNKTFEILQQNIALNSYCNIEAVNLGIGEQTGIATMFIGNHSNLNSMTIIPGMVTRQIRVQIDSLDHFLVGRKYPKFIRMDVEGYEYDILKGMIDLLNSGSELTILMELHFHLLGREKSAKILNDLKDYGFKILITTFEPTVGIRNRFLLNLRDFLEMRLISAPISHGYWQVSIEDILNNKDVMNGRFDALEIFFQR